MKFNIIRHIPQITDQEVESKQNFDRLLQDRIDYLKFVKKMRNIRLLFGTALIVIIVATLAIVTIKQEEKQHLSSFTAPLGQIKMDVDLREVSHQSQSSKLGTIEEKKANLNHDKKQRLIRTKISVTTNDTLSVSSKAPKVEQQFKKAYPIIGMDSLQQYFKQNIQYPALSLADSSFVTGTVLVLFTLDSTGRPTQLSIRNSIGPMFDQEAKRLIMNMPQWKPAFINGKQTASKISIPIVFNYEK